MLLVPPLAAGLAAWRRGDLDRAAELVRESLRLQVHLNQRMATALGLEMLAWIAASGRQYERAAVLLGAAASLWSSIGTTLGHLHLYPRG